MGSGSSACWSQPQEATAQTQEQDYVLGNSQPMQMQTIEDRRPSAISISNGGPEIAKEVLVTPRREKALYSGVVNTPKGAEIHVYKYFCPICTLYYEDILRSQCCGNYSCINCTQRYLGVKGCKVDSVSDILRINKPELPCLSCNTVGFQPKLVHREEVIRDYLRDDDASPNSARTGKVLHSPIKIGDSYENLKRKMQPFPVVNKQLQFIDEFGGCNDLSKSPADDNLEDEAAYIAGVVAADVSTSARDNSLSHVNMELCSSDSSPAVDTVHDAVSVAISDFPVSSNAGIISPELQHEATERTVRQ